MQAQLRRHDDRRAASRVRRRGRVGRTCGDGCDPDRGERVTETPHRTRPARCAKIGSRGQGRFASWVGSGPPHDRVGPRVWPSAERLRWKPGQRASRPLHMHPDERFLSMSPKRSSGPIHSASTSDTPRSPAHPYNQPETPSFVDALCRSSSQGRQHNANDDSRGPGDSYDSTVKWGRG